MPRPTPFDLVFHRVAESSFPRIAASLAAAGANPADRDAFLMDREVITLLRELRPEEGLGEAMDQMVALVHHAYLSWAAGAVTISVNRPDAEELLSSTPARAEKPQAVSSYYAQFPERMIWASVIEDDVPEPLDGVFVSPGPGDDLRVLGIFGLRPERGGFSAVEASGSRAENLVREDGSALFDPTLEGGAAAGLRSIIGEAELLELGWRTRWKP